jgi:ribosomal peptide maturation radical SAM protein 1
VLRIALVNMPFAAVALPSLGLTQLAGVLRRTFGTKVEVDVRYVNHDFACYFGEERYRAVAEDPAHQFTGIGDWLFRQAAFPEAADNTAAYVRRFYPGSAPTTTAFRTAIAEKRAGLRGFLGDMIVRHGLDGADVVGFTSMFFQNVASLALARALKERRPQVVTVMGGANCEAPMGRAIADEFAPIDYVCSGPALKSFPELVGLLLAGRRDEIARIPGVLTRGSAELEPRAELGAELDIETDIELDYDPFLRSLEHSSSGSACEPALLLETSRGCWWGERQHCTFCGLNGLTMAYRAMSPALALQTFRRLMERYPDVKTYWCVDNIMPKSYVREVFAKLRPPPDVDIFYEVKADLDADELEILANARVTILQPGIESLASSTLKLMRKGTTAFTNLTFLKNAARLGLWVDWNLLVGFPGELEAVYLKYVDDLPKLVHLPPPRGPVPVRFDRFGPYFNEAAAYGLKLKPADFYEHIYPLPEAARQRLAYFFTDRNFSAAYLQTMAKWFRTMTDKVAEWRRRHFGQDGKSPARLFLAQRTASGGRIHDSRSGAAVEHVLPAAAMAILDALERPTWERELPERVRDDADSVAAHVLDLDRRGLIFRENGRLMSVVGAAPVEIGAGGVTSRVRRRECVV